MFVCLVNLMVILVIEYVVESKLRRFLVGYDSCRRVYFIFERIILFVFIEV